MTYVFVQENFNTGLDLTFSSPKIEELQPPRYVLDVKQWADLLK